jgi:hypothetical protein
MILGTNMGCTTRPTAVIFRTTAARRSSGRSSTAILRPKVPRRPTGTTVVKPAPTTARPTVREVMRLPGRGTARTDNAMPRELARTRSSRHRRPAVVHRRPEVPVARGKVLMIPLHRSSFEVMITLRSQLV